jgi:MFS family permease
MQGLYLLWFVQEKQISPVIVATALAAGDLALMGLELPTGWFADRFGHRRSLIVGSLVQVMGMLACWLGEGVSGLVVASVLVALGDGFRSGADQALLYRTCLALDREHDFQKIEARTGAVTLGALVLQVLIGGALVHYGGFAIGWFAETVLCLLGLAIAWGMVEPPAHPSRTGDEEARADGSSPVRYRSLATAIAPAALLGGAASAASFLAQTTGANTPAYVTVLVATLAAAEAGGCALASRLRSARPRVQIQLAAFGSILFVGAVALPATLTIVAVVLAVLLGVAQPLRAAAIQRLASDGIRARAASAASASDMAISTLVLPLAGLWRSRQRR